MLAFSSKRTKINRVLLLSFFNYIEYIAGIGIVITATVSTAGFNLQICENVLVLFAFHFPLFLRQIWYWFRRVVESILCQYMLQGFLSFKKFCVERSLFNQTNFKTETKDFPYRKMSSLHLECGRQCEQMVTLIFKVWPFTTKTICPLHDMFAKVV